MKRFCAKFIIVVTSFQLALTSCKTRKSSLEGASGGSCGDCCNLDPELKEREGTPESIREAARLKVFLMKEGFENGNPLAMIILAKLMRNKMLGESLSIEQYLTKIGASSNGAQDINETALKQAADQFRDGMLTGNAKIPGENSLTATNANLQEMLTSGLVKISDPAGRKLLIADVQEAMASYFEASGTQAFGQKSTLKPAQAMVMVDILVDSVVGAKMDFVTTSNGSAKTQLPFEKELDLQVGKSYADAIYAKVSRMSALDKVDASEIAATELMLKTFREAVKDKSQMAEVAAALEVLKRSEKSSMDALREGKVTVNGKVAEVRFEEGFSRDAFLKTISDKKLEGRVRENFREADKSVRR